MMKKFLAAVLAITVSAVVFCGCNQNKKATISKDEQTTTQSSTESVDISSGIKQSGVKETKKLEGEKSRLNKFMDIVKSGTFTVKGTLKNKSMGLVTENPITIAAMNSTEYYYNAVTVAASQEYLIHDGETFVLNSADSTYADCESKTADSVKNGINTYLPSLTTLKYVDTYEVEYGKNSYVRERYELKNNVGEEQTVSYFFDGDELSIIRYDSNVLETVIQSDFHVLSFENTADDTLFKIPDGYEKISESQLEQNKNNTASSSEYILALFESLGITDEDLEKMGYTKEQVLEMTEQEQSVFLAELFGEDFS